MSKHTKDSTTKPEKTVPGIGDEVREVEASADGANDEPEATTGKESELEAVRCEIETFKAQVAELNEKYLRKLADEVNFRKRMQREKEDAQKYGIASLLSDLVPILDDLDRGIASAENTKNYEQIHEGLLLIRRQLSQMLENKYALKRFDSKGQPFDPNRHEAIFAEPGDVEEPLVSEEYLSGYSLHDRVLRAAKVRVRIPAPKKAEDDQKPADEVSQA